MQWASAVHCEKLMANNIQTISAQYGRQSQCKGVEMRQLSVLIYGAMLGISAMIPASAQEPLLTNRVTELRAAPDDTATVVKLLAEKAPVQLQERKGAWSRVKSANDTGWVRMMHLRGGTTIASDQQSSGGGWLASMNRLLSASDSRTNQRAQSATVGIRGFSKDDLAQAELNPAEFAKLKRYQASSADAQQLAGQGSLSFRSVAYLAQDAVDGANAAGAKK